MVKDPEAVTETEQVFKAAKTAGQRMLTIAFAVVMTGLTMLYADIDVSFSSRLDAVNRQSGGQPMDTSFTFELGSFAPGFNPTSGNTNLWMSNWTPAPNAGSGGSDAAYTQVGLGSLTPNTGASNNFSGSVTLNTNGSPFTTSDQGYIWGYDDRGTSGTGEWILITNPSWEFPAVVPGPQVGGPNWRVSDAGTVTVGGIGSVNPGHTLVTDPPHMQTSSVILLPVPEPSVAMLLAGAATIFLRRRRG